MPPASASLLPPAFRWLMTDARSPILDFYPEKFDVDMEGKRAEWEGVVKVPFVSESRLLEAVASIPTDRCVCWVCVCVFRGGCFVLGLCVERLVQCSVLLL